MLIRRRFGPDSMDDGRSEDVRRGRRRTRDGLSVTARGAWQQSQSLRMLRGAPLEYIKQMEDRGLL